MIFKIKLVLLALFVSIVQCQDDFLYGTFPDGFQWGASSSSYQIEGAWNLNGKGENIWDRMVHEVPSPISNGDTGDVAADSYHRYQDDVAALKETGVDFYRFSMSWSRILPTGRKEIINQDGIDYYNRLIDALLAEGIAPRVTLYHWDLPQALQDDFRGFLDEQLVDVFGDYARIVYQNFGDRVKSWITFNEPWMVCEMGHGYGSDAPRVVGSGRTDYICSANLLKSHARAWHIYNDEFRATQNGEVGISLDSGYFEPMFPAQIDVDSAERALQFKLGWFAHPIFSTSGDWPPVMKEFIGRHSTEEGLSESRLPELGAFWVDYIRGTADFFGLNHYSTTLAAYADVFGTPPNYDNDMNVWTRADPEWPSTIADWLKVVPWGFRKILNWIKNEYNNPKVVVTENGYIDTGDINDTGRIDYHRSYINEMMKAVNLDGCNVFGYSVWSIIDDFEWNGGFGAKFGLYHVDFNDPSRPRTRKESSRAYAKIISDNGFPASDKEENLK